MNQPVSIRAKALAAAQAMDDFMSSFTTETTCTQLRDAMTALQIFEDACKARSGYELLIAHLADKRAAGNLVGSSNPADFVAAVFGVSYKKAWALIHQGNRMFAPPPEPKPSPRQDPEDSQDEQPTDSVEDSGYSASRNQDSGTEGAGGSAEAPKDGQNPGSDQNTRDDSGQLGEDTSNSRKPSGSPADEEAQERARRYERELAAHEEVHRKLKKYPLGSEKQRAVAYELAELKEDACPGYKELLSKAIDEARYRSVQDLRMWVRRQVARANRRSRDPLAGYLK